MSHAPHKPPVFTPTSDGALAPANCSAAPLCSKCKTPVGPVVSASTANILSRAKFTLTGWLCAKCGHWNNLKRRKSWRQNDPSSAAAKVDGSQPSAEARCSAAPVECEEAVIEKIATKAVIEKIRSRREAGRRKYGTTMERTDLTKLQWLQHAQEEAMDLAVYLERLMREERQNDQAHA